MLLLPHKKMEDEMAKRHNKEGSYPKIFVFFNRNLACFLYFLHYLCDIREKYTKRERIFGEKKNLS